MDPVTWSDFQRPAMQLWQSEVSAPVAEGLQVVAGESGDGIAGAWMALESVRHVRAHSWRRLLVCPASL